ncbi:MAG: ribonucleoside-diphosphate reductase subunit alpha [Rhizobiales bacterium]|nr:ribonucleoside-diphosphate reductase subunit alpha [Hyphomicrobiales bacterium]NRB13617.1 ribonucleoside-diphosphate reductase subunit alpha [Hyphomicrobiales bacterium]
MVRLKRVLLPENSLESINKTIPEGVQLEKRSGKRALFSPAPIFAALHKAMMATKQVELTASNVYEESITLTEQAIASIMKRVESYGVIHQEDVQDQVELTLMRAGHYEVAKNYIIYRQARADQRDQVDQITTTHAGRLSQMKVVKRDGEQQAVSLNKITNRVSVLAADLNVDPILVSQSAVAGLHDGITTEEIDNFLSETAAALTTDHPDYAIIAGRIKVDGLHKDTGGFRHATEVLHKAGMVNDHHYKKVMDNIDVIEQMINYDLDYTFDYFALTTLMRAYFLKVDDKPVERPQDLWMRCALTVTGDKFDADKVKTTYDQLSQGYYTHATPTLFNSGTNLQQLSSCFLLAMEDDSIEGIFNTMKDCALISKTAGGIGLHAHNIRANGARIKSTGGRSNGLVPFLKVLNETVRAVDQGGGKRKGVAAVYLEPWHGDIEAFLELRKNTGAEEFRTRDLFLAMWIPDLFMQRVEADQDWTLMSQDTCPLLSDTSGAEFEKLYTQYEAEGRGLKTVKARDIMSRIIESQIETGQPYMCYKDAMNSKSNQKNLGTIKSSNLCAEIAEYSSKEETAVCNLASIALPKFVQDNGTFDYQGLYDVAYNATINLNNVIDVNYYPTAKTELSNNRHRPIGLGMQGLADVYFKLSLAYDSSEAADINRKVFETIYFASVTASKDAAQQSGVYESYEGSPMSLGEFQFDMWDAQDQGPKAAGHELMWDWAKLRKQVKKYGVRNSLLTACMPTASTGIILGNTETFQAQTSNLYKRQTLSGEFMLINKFLVADLVKQDLWNNEMRDKIVLENGSVQNIPEVSTKLKEIYKTVWEISQKTIINMSADRAPFIDQSQSMNLWLEDASFGQVNSMHFYAWKAGLKTGMYYLRSKPAANNVKVTVSADRKTEQVAATSTAPIVDCTDEICVVCSA